MNTIERTLSVTHQIALFPLKLVVFPGEYLNLHIFEPRYKQLINECDQTGNRFGIPSFFEQQSLEYGTEMELVEIAHTYPDGRMDIKTLGKRVFKILDFNKTAEDKLYPDGFVQFLENDLNGEIILNTQILNLIKELYQIMNIKKEVPELNDQFSAYGIAHHIGLSYEQEYHLLSIEREVKRQEFIIQHMKDLIPTVVEMEKLRKKVKMNGHFKNLYPPKI